MMSQATHKEFEWLLSELADGELTDAQLARLAELVDADDEARELYLDHCKLHAQLAWEHGALGGLELLDELVDRPRATHTPRSAGRYRLWFAALAAMVAIVTGVFLMFVDDAPVPVVLGEPVATLTQHSGAVLAPVGGEQQAVASGARVRIGEYALSTGVAEIRFDNGVEVLLEAPSRFRVESAQRMMLHEGRLAARVTEKGVGFTVDTPGAEAVDFGTEFAVEVSPEHGSEVHVFDGEVEVKPKLSGTQIEPVRLVSNTATHIDALTRAPLGIALDADRFQRTLREPESDYASLIMQFQPTLYYTMAPGPEGDRLLDRSPNRIDGRIDRGQMKRPSFAPGHVGSALRLGGPRAGSFAVVDDYPKALDDRLTVVAWVYATSRTRWASIAKNWAPKKNGQFHFGLFRDHGGLELHLRQRDGSEVIARDPEPLPIGQWQHVAFVADGQFVRLYRQGELVAEQPYSGIVSPTEKAMAIGAKLTPAMKNPEAATAGLWHGRIDELALFNRALTPEQIRELYHADRNTTMIR